MTHQNQRVLITAAASGIGLVMADAFTAAGARVYICDADASALDSALQSRPHLRGMLCDVTQEAQVRDLFAQATAHLGGLDILVSNAAIDGSAPFLEMTEEEWHRVLNVNLTASFLLGQLAARAMVADGGGGCILYTASVSGMGASEGDVHYGVSKAGVINLVQTMALELVKLGIRVNCVSPGPLDTPLSRALLGSDEAMERARQHFPLVPMGRLGLPEEIAAAYAYLASSDGAFTTGQNLVIDGGSSASLFINPEGSFDE